LILNSIMVEIVMFELSEQEFKAKSKALAAKELALIQAEIDKDLSAREFNERLKKLRAEIAVLAKEVDEERAVREPTADEAPWASLMDDAVGIARGRRPRRRRTRDRTGEYPEPEEEDEDEEK
jgi:hypothetical protein